MKRFNLRYDETSLSLDELKRRWADMCAVSTADFSNGMDAFNLTRLNRDSVRNAEIRDQICSLFDNEIAAGSLVASVGEDGKRHVSGLELTRFADSKGVEITQGKRPGGRPSHAEGWYDQLESIERLTALQKSESQQTLPARAASEDITEAGTDGVNGPSPCASGTKLQEQSEEQVELGVTSEFQTAPTNESRRHGVSGDENGPIPGDMPKISIGKLAVRAAWAIECEEKRRATAKKVLECLQKWADEGKEPDVLRKSDRDNHRVFWITSKLKEKSYTLEACQKTLEGWNKSRQ